MIQNYLSIRMDGLIGSINEFVIVPLLLDIDAIKFDAFADCSSECSSHILIIRTEYLVSTAVSWRGKNVIPSG